MAFPRLARRTTWCGIPGMTNLAVRGMAEVYHRWGVESIKIRDSANAARTPDPARRNRLALSLIYFPACEKFHERKCFCKSGTYVKWDPSKTALAGAKRYQVPIKSVQEV